MNDIPRVRKQEIDELMSLVEYKCRHIEGTQTTVCLAILNGFTLACEYSACIDPRLFDAKIGQDIAMERAKKVAEDTLWLVKGWELKQSIPA